METVKDERDSSKIATKLTPAQQKRALSGSKRQKKHVVHTLDSPFDITWAEISAEDQSRIEALFKETLVPLRLPNERFNKAELQAIPRAERRLARQARRAEALSKDAFLLKQRHEQKKSLLLGINAVTRHLETMTDSSIEVVLCDRTAQPSLLTKFLIPLCQSRNVGLVPVRNLAALLQSTLGLPRCLALAVRSTAAESATDSQMEHLKRELSGMASHPSNSTLKEPASHAIASPLPVPSTPHVIQSSVDVSKFHLPKPQSGLAFVPGKAAKSICAIEPGAFGADFIRFDGGESQVPNSPSYQSLSVKRLHSHGDKPGNKRPGKKLKGP